MTYRRFTLYSDQCKINSRRYIQSGHLEENCYQRESTARDRRFDHERARVP